MEKKQIYAIAAVLVILVAAVGIYIFVSDDAKSEDEALLDAAGNAISIPESDNITITAASPSVADLLCYMGYASNIICVSTYCDNPELPDDLLSCGSYFSPETDAISNADATITFIDSSGRGSLDVYNALKSSGLKNVVMLYGASDEIDGLYKNIEIVGYMMGGASEADELTSTLKNIISSYDDVATGSENKSVLITTGLGLLSVNSNGYFVNLDSFDGSSVYVSGADSALCSLASLVSNIKFPLAGDDWVQADTDWVSTSTGDVDVLIVLWTNMESMPNDDAISALMEKLKTTAWANCGAVTSGNVFFIGGSSGNDLSRVTPYTVERGLSILALYLVPEAYAATAGGDALSWADLPSTVDNSNSDELAGYIANKLS